MIKEEYYGKLFVFRFTLIELLIVVAIIGILAAIAVPNFLNAQTKARIARVQSDAKSTETALEQYRLDNNAYPVDAFNQNPVGLKMLTTPTAFLSSIPVDIFKPQNNELIQQLDSGGGRFLELGTDTGQERVVGSWLLISAGPDKDDDVNSHASWPFGSSFWEFEVSNGLHSNGDIIRMGGNASQGNYKRNGVPNR